MAEKFSSQKLQLIQKAFLFHGVDEIVVERIVTDDRCGVKKYEKGQVIFDETHFVPSLGILLSGEVQTEKNIAEGKRLKLSRTGPGGAFGAATMFHEKGRFVNVISATKPTEVLFLPEELIRWAMQRHPVITDNYISYLSQRIWFLNDRIAALTAGDTQQKLAVYLLSDDGTACSMTELSQSLNIGRASLYRALEDMEAQGLIVHEKKRISIVNVDGLRNLIL